MSVTLQVRLNGGAAASGAVTAAEGDAVQLTAASKAGWAATPLPRWEIVDSPPGFAVPAGWSTDAVTGAYYYEHATNDPPSFTITAGHWGKFILALKVTDVSTPTTDRATAIKVLSPGGLEDIGRGERDVFGGARKRWVAPLQSLVRAVENLISDVAESLSLTSSGETVELTRVGANSWDLAGTGSEVVLVNGVVPSGVPSIVRHTSNGTLVPDAINILSGVVTAMTLPTASTWAGKAVVVKKAGILADVVISRSNSDLIDGELSYALTGEYGLASFIADDVSAVIYAAPGLS